MPAPKKRKTLAEYFENCREWGAEISSVPPDLVRLHFPDGREFVSPIPAVSPGEAPSAAPDYYLSSDNRRLDCGDGTSYRFSVNQGLCVRVLMDAWEDREPEKTEGEILTEAGVKAPRLRDVFRTGGKPHPAWETVIVSPSKGTYRLAEL